MRIRRRGPGQQPITYLLPSDPYPPAPLSSSPPPPASSRDDPLPENKRGDEGLHLHPTADSAAADLGAAARSSSSASASPLGLGLPALPPQDGAAVEQRGKGLLLGAQHQQQQQQQLQQGPADSSSLENGLHRHVPEEPVPTQAGTGKLILSNNNGGVGAAAVVTTTAATKGAKKATKKQKPQQVAKNTTSGAGVKRERAPPSPTSKEKEGTRCSRKNGRGWRCSQLTPQGYSLCEYHLGKGRVKSENAEIGRRGPGQLGRTEHPNKTSATAAVAPATAAGPSGSAAASGQRGPGQLGRTKKAKKTSAAAVAPATTAAPKADVPPAPAPALPPPTSVQHA